MLLEVQVLKARRVLQDKGQQEQQVLKAQSDSQVTKVLLVLQGKDPLVQQVLKVH